MSKMSLSEELRWRGFINQTTFADLSELDGTEWFFYHGFDASADSQTVGNLASMMMDKVFMRHGHKAILLAGGATSLIGDPGGKDRERTLQDENTVARNISKAEEQLKKIFNGYEFTLVNNLEWFRDMTVLRFLRDVGKHFSMTPLVQRDYIAKRMGLGGPGISYTEFSYTILQGYDFWHLYKKYGVNLQLAGADQWGNSISGVDLIRRAEGQTVHAMTCPLVVDRVTGRKFGKSEEGAIWLDPKKTSPYKFYQFWLSTDDKSVEDYLKVFTELDKEEISDRMADFTKDKQGRLAQKTLAYEVTKLVHSKEQADRQQRIANALFSGQDISKLDDEDIKTMRDEIPSTKVSTGVSIAEVLVSTGLASSKSEAKQLLGGKAVYINNQPAGKETIEKTDFIDGKLLLRKGKVLKNTALVELVS